MAKARDSGTVESKAILKDIAFRFVDYVEQNGYFKVIIG